MLRQSKRRGTCLCAVLTVKFWDRMVWIHKVGSLFRLSFNSKGLLMENTPVKKTLTMLASYFGAVGAVCPHFVNLHHCILS